MFSTINVGSSDRVARIVAGVILIAITLLSSGISSGLNLLLWVVGIVLILTALVRFCPLYKLLGTSTNKDQ